MNAQHLQLHVAHHEIYTKKTVLFIGKNRQRSCIANFEATLSMRSSNASTRRHQCTLSVRFFPFSEATHDWPELTVADVLQDERTRLMQLPKPFDG